MKTILIVEDDPAIGKSLVNSLKLEGYRPTLATSLASARRALEAERFDLALLDVGLPDGNGFELCAEIGEIHPGLPVLMLTARADEKSAVRGLSAGAVDYIRKPFGYLELQARLRKHLKEKQGVLQAGDLVLKLDDRSLWWRGQAVAVPPREFAILGRLMAKLGEAVPRESLTDDLFGEQDVLDRTLDSHVSKLRARLRKANVTGLEIASVYGFGYRLEKK